MSSCNSKTHKLVIKTLGSSVTREWVRLSDGQLETDAATLSALEASLADEECGGESNCVESQEWTYGIDNTGTDFADTATYEITLSNGTKLQFEQTPTTGWAAQLTQWAAAIQQVADNAGLVWFSDARTVNNVVPSDISGGYGANSTPTGLPGAPSVPIAQGLIDGGMSVRYVNIQICPAQSVPVKFERITSATYTNNPYILNTAGAILGPMTRYYVCESCGQAPIWYHDDRVTKVDEGQIPNCYVPCGTLSLTPSPPESECQFFFADGCDNNGSNDIADFVTGITRRSTICSDGGISLDYFEADPADPAALIDYTLMGEFVDCATGETVPEAAPDCEDFEIVKFWQKSGFNAGFTNKEWSTGDATLPSSNAQAASDYVANFDYSIAPTTDTVVTTNIAYINDTENSSAVFDFQIREGYVVVESPLYIRWTANSEGTLLVDFGKCGGDYERVIELSKEVGIEVTDALYLPVGVHKLRLYNVDNGSTNSAWIGQVSQDNVTFVSDNTVLDALASTTDVAFTCLNAKVCKPSGLIYRLSDGESLDTAELYDCPVACASESSSATASNTHLIEGCILDGTDKISAYTIIDDDGAALFAPKPLSDLGFVDCCED